MGATILSIHSTTPELRKINTVVKAIKDGAVILYPTDTGFTLGCDLSNKDAISRIRSIRRLNSNKAMTFLCDSLSHVSEFARVSNLAYKNIKRLIPGPYTFILPASKMVPKFAQDPKRSTAGIRVSHDKLVQLLLQELGHPLISISAKLADRETPSDPEELIDAFKNVVDIAVSSDEYNFVGESTVLDMTTDNFLLVREGANFEQVEELIDFDTVES